MGDEVQVKEKRQGHVSDTWGIQCCCHSCSQNIVLQQALDKVHKKKSQEMQIGFFALKRARKSPVAKESCSFYPQTSKSFICR